MRKGKRSMRFKYIVVVIIIIICLLGCENNTESSNIYNEINGMFTSVNDSVYYIDRNTLYEYNNGRFNKLYENVISVQKYDDTVYFIYTDDYRSYSLYEKSEDRVEKIFDLDNGTYQQSILYNNELYSCINNKITVYDLQTKESEPLAIENTVSRFCINNNIVYYWNIEFIDNGFDAYVNSINSSDELNLYEGTLYSFDIHSNETTEICNAFSKNDKYFLSPTKYGVVFFDPDQSNLNIYNGKIKTIFHGDVLSMITDDKNIYYSIGDNNIYQIDFDTNDINIFIYNVNEIYGFDDQYVYSDKGINGR